MGLTFATGPIFFITFKNIKNIFEEQSVILLKQNAKKIYIIYILKISLKNLGGPLPPLSNNSSVPNINIICDCIFLTFDSLYIYIYIWQFYPHIIQYQHHIWLYFCHNWWFLYFFHGFKNWIGQFNREPDNNLVWLCLKTRNVRKSRFSLHLWSMFYAFPNESIFSISLVYYSQNPQVPLFSNFFFKTESHGTIHIFKNYFTVIFSVFNNK